MFEIRRILKAFVDAQWLAGFDQELAKYAVQVGAGQVGAGQVGAGQVGAGQVGAGHPDGEVTR